MAERVRQALIGLAGLVLLMPLVVVPLFSYPFVFPKVVLFRGLVVVMAALWALLLFAAPREFRPRCRALTLAFTALVLSAAVSTFAGVDVRRSLWGDWTRMLGLLTLLHYFVFYLVLTAVVTEPRVWRRLLRTSVVVGGVAAAVALIQTIDPEFFFNSGTVRVVGTLGHPGYLAGLEVLCVGVALILLAQGETGLWRVAISICGLLGLIAIGISETRGTLIALGFAVVAWLLLQALTAGVRQRRFAVAALGAVIVVITLMTVFRDSPVARQVPGWRRFAAVSLQGESVRTRLMAWSIAIDAWRDRPLVGWGPNNYTYTFDRYFDPEFVNFSWEETYFDDAHNAVLNTLAVQGVVGVLALLAIYAAAAHAIVRARRLGTLGRAAACIAGALLVGHFAHNLFLFDTPASLLFFVLLLGYLDVASRPPTENNAKRRTAIARTGISAGVLLWSLSAAAVFIYFTDVNPARVNRLAARTWKAVQDRDPTALELRARFSRIPTADRTDARALFAQAAQGALRDFHQRHGAETARRLAEAADEDLRLNISVRPLESRYEIWRAKLALQRNLVLGEREPLVESRDGLRRALRNAPRRLDLTFTLAAIELQLGEWTEAVGRLERAVAETPTIGEAHWRLALIYQAVGREDDARRVAAAAERSEIRFTEQGRRVLQTILDSPPRQAPSGPQPPALPPAPQRQP